MAPMSVRVDMATPEFVGMAGVRVTLFGREAVGGAGGAATGRGPPLGLAAGSADVDGGHGQTQDLVGGAAPEGGGGERVGGGLADLATQGGGDPPDDHERVAVGTG